MGALDAPARKVTRKLIAKFGQEAILRTATEGDYDPSTGVTRTELDRIVRVILEGARRNSEDYVDQRGRTLLAAADGLADDDGVLRLPDGGDRFILGATIISRDPVAWTDGKEHEIIDMEELYANEQVYAYRFTVQR